MRFRKQKGNYRSGYEKKVRAKLDAAEINYGYEEDVLKYTIPESTHKYTPDISIKGEEGVLYFIECKGYFGRPEDRNKILYVRTANPDKDIRLMFQNATKPIRKGSKTTYGDWATKNGFLWCDSQDGSLPERWNGECRE